MDVDLFSSVRLQAMVRFARVLTGDRGLAEDLVQDVFLDLHAFPERFRDAENLDAYLRRAITNRYLSWGRKWFRVRPTERLPDRAIAAVAVESVLDRDELRHELARLPPRQRAVIVLRYYADLDDGEIADLLGCSASTVRSHASRALACLRVEILNSNDLLGERP